MKPSTGGCQQLNSTGACLTASKTQQHRYTWRFCPEPSVTQTVDKAIYLDIVSVEVWTETMSPDQVSQVSEILQEEDWVENGYPCSTPHSHCDWWRQCRASGLNVVLLLPHLHTKLFGTDFFKFQVPLASFTVRCPWFTHYFSYFQCPKIHEKSSTEMLTQKHNSLSLF